MKTMKENHADFFAAEEAAKQELHRLGYGTRWYGGKRHIINGLLPGQTYYQEQFPGGYETWQGALAWVKGEEM